jgi:prophage regulatory protein
MPDKNLAPSTVLRLKDVQRRVALSRSAIYSRRADSDFPAPIKLGPRAIGWLQSDVDRWLESRQRKASAKAVNP